MSLTLPSAEMLETPPGYPFEEINYEDIEVEEVSVCIYVFIPAGTWQDFVNAVRPQLKTDSWSLIPLVNLSPFFF